MDRPVCFSVVTICYNCEHEIEATLLSVLNQTYADVDYVIIDGKSSDGSMLIVNKYRERIATVVSEPDSGIYNAMNKGLSHCKGDYVIFMNAGDVFASDDVLARLNDIILMQEMRPSLVYGTYMESRRGTEIPNRDYRKCWYGMFASHQAMAYDLDFVRTQGIGYDETYRIAADYKFTISVVSKSRQTGRTVLRTNVCMAKFDTTGISCSNPDLGLAEADRARGEVLGYGKVRLTLIHNLLLLARFMKNHLKGIYEILRYS